MRNIQKILTLLFICTLVTATLLVSGCTETAPDIENVEPETISLNDIVDIEWQWSGLVETEPASQSVVPDPESYTITFSNDGTYSIKADCNRGSGTYTLEGNELTIAPGPITLAYCGSDSLDSQYLSLLNNVINVSMDNDQLILGMGNNGDIMMFVKDEGVSDDNKESEPLSSFNGTISSIEDEQQYPMLLLESEEIRSSGHMNGIKFVVSEETAIVDPNGGLFDIDNLKEGMKLRVFCSPALTKSIPPIGQATLIQLI